LKRQKQSAADKAAARAKEIPTRKGKHGGTLRIGNPGNKGGTGRPPNAFRHFCQEVLADPNTRKAIRKIARSSDNPASVNLFGKLALFGYGPPRSEGSEDSDVQVVMDC
jgi:hypothetical protein